MEKSKIAKNIESELAIRIVNKVIENAESTLSSLFSSSLVLTEWDSAYCKMHEIIYKLDKEKYAKYRLPTKNKDYYDLSDGTYYRIKIGKRNSIRVSMGKMGNDTFPIKILNVIITGPNRQQIRSSLIRKVLLHRDENIIHVNHLGTSMNSQEIHPHDFKNIILDKETKMKIVTGLYNWTKSKDWYKEHQLIHKIGVLLYGEPGTGKSTIIRAISSMFHNAPIAIISPTNIGNSVNDLISFRKKESGIIIVVLEDFDMFFYDRDATNEQPSEGENNQQNSHDRKTQETKNSAQNTVFQILDGIYSTEDTIYIATTNHLEKLDSAMIRHGRFDIQEKIGLFNEAQAIEFLNLFGYNKDFYEKEVKENIELPVQPSKLQAWIMEYRSKSILQTKIK